MSTKQTDVWPGAVDLDGSTTQQATENLPERTAIWPPRRRMPYIEATLTRKEKVVAVAEIHWAFCLPAILACIIPPIGLPLLILSIFQRRAIEIVMTDQRIILKTGLFFHHTCEMRLTKIENIQLDQDPLGRVLGYGDLTVVGTGGTRERLPCVTSPVALHKTIRSRLDQNYTNNYEKR